MQNLRLITSERERRRLTREQKKRMQRIFAEVAEMLAKKAEKYPPDSLDMRFVWEMMKFLKTEIALRRDAMVGIVENSLYTMSATVVQENADIWREYGLNLSGSVASIPMDIVQSLVSGQLYASPWSLDQSIWGATQNIERTVQNIVAAGIAGNQTTLEIAQNLESYVNPTVSRASRVIHYTDVNGHRQVFYFGRADYYAQRLARTMISHAYQQSFVRVTRKNPFITKYKWLASNSRPCPICQQRDGRLFEKDELPLDHPNGMCTFVSVIEMDDDAITDRILEWGRHPPGYDRELDEFIVDIGARNSTGR